MNQKISKISAEIIIPFASREKVVEICEELKSILLKYNISILGYIKMTDGEIRVEEVNKK